MNDEGEQSTWQVIHDGCVAQTWNEELEELHGTDETTFEIQRNAFLAEGNDFSDVRQVLGEHEMIAVQSWGKDLFKIMII